MSFKSICFSFLIILSSVLSGCENPTKITDPHDPKFLVEDFRWDDHSKTNEFTDALRFLLPVGLNKEEVEKILLVDPRAKLSKVKSVADQKKATRGFLIGPSQDVILYRDPRFQKASTIISYTNPARKWSFTPSSRIIRAYYDENDKLLNLALYTEIIHVLPPPSER